MQWKVIAALLGLLVIALLAYAFLSLIVSGGNPSFRGPEGAPYVKGPSGPPPSAPLKTCPEAWYENRMPTVGTTTEPREYFVLNGTRRELSEFDVAWVRQNCNIEPQVVY